MSKPIIKANLKGSDKIELVYNDRAVEMTITDFFTNLPSNTLVISNTPSPATSGIYSGSGFLPGNITVNGLSGYTIYFTAIDEFKIFANKFLLENGECAFTSGNYEGTIDIDTLTDNQTYTLPNHSGEIQVGPAVKRYKALLSQNAPIASQTSGTFTVGQIWTIETYVGGIGEAKSNTILTPGTGYVSGIGYSPIGGSGVGMIVNYTASAGAVTLVTITNGGSGYEVGDILTIAVGIGDATFEITALADDDFSNMELISGTMNTTGAVIRATSTTPTDWSNGSDLSYDGAPYVVSTDSNGDLNPLVNTLGGTLVWSYDSVGYYKATLAGAFTSNTIVNIGDGGSTDFYNKTFPNSYTTNEVNIFTSLLSNIGGGDNDCLLKTLVEIEVYP